MKKNTLSILLILSFAFSACGRQPVADSGQAPVAESPAASQSKVSEETKDEKFKGSLRDLLAKAVPVKCSFVMADDGSSQDSTLYMSGRRMRMDGVAESEGQKIESHMIYDGDYSYAWSSAAPASGMKMKVPEKASTDSQEENDGRTDFDQELEMDCDPWIVDESVFSLPAGVQFQDASAMMEAVSGESSAACRACDMMPDGPDRQQCYQSVCAD
jgi:hypothetical protein